MAAKLVILVAGLLAVFPYRSNAQSALALPKFMGRQVTIIPPEADADGFFPKGPASICIEGPPQRQCYTVPKDFGNNPRVELVQLKRGMSALLFSAESGGVSGWQVYFALLQPGTGKELGDLFLSDTRVSNQNQHAFWSVPTVSDAQIFLTADYVWGRTKAITDRIGT